MNRFSPEGTRLNLDSNLKYLSSELSIHQAYTDHTILEAPVIMCSASKDLIVDLGCTHGIIPYSETVYTVDGTPPRDIAVISLVGKPVCFKVIDYQLINNAHVPVLSRKAAQKDVLDYMLLTLTPGDVIPAVVTHLERFGIFADIGCGIVSMLGIDAISVARISHPSVRFSRGMNIFAVVTGIDHERKRINISHKELLGTWSENAARFSPFETVIGTVRGITDYGIFVELAPNLSGLAEPKDNICIGDSVSVYIKSINPEKMKIKLVIISKTASVKNPELKYYITSGKIHTWQYSPSEYSGSSISTVFSDQL